MAAHTPKSLAFARLGSSEADVYTAPASTKGLVHNIVLHNGDDSTAYAASLFVRDASGNDWRIFSSSIAAKGTVIVDFANEGLVLEAGWKLRGHAGTADKISIAVCGSERV